MFNQLHSVTVRCSTAHEVHHVNQIKLLALIGWHLFLFAMASTGPVSTLPCYILQLWRGYMLENSLS
jgi:hypothetical protein